MIVTWCNSNIYNLTTNCRFHMAFCPFNITLDLLLKCLCLLAIIRYFYYLWILSQNSQKEISYPQRDQVPYLKNSPGAKCIFVVSHKYCRGIRPLYGEGHNIIFQKKKYMTTQVHKTVTLISKLTLKLWSYIFKDLVSI